MCNGVYISGLDIVIADMLLPCPLPRYSGKDYAYASSFLDEFFKYYLYVYHRHSLQCSTRGGGGGGGGNWDITESRFPHPKNFEITLLAYREQV